MGRRIGESSGVGRVFGGRMRRIDKFLGRGEQESVRYPHDIAELKKNIPELMLVSDIKVESIYGDFSEEYSAGWLILDENRIEEFRNWLYSRE